MSRVFRTRPGGRRTLTVAKDEDPLRGPVRRHYVTDRVGLQALVQFLLTCHIQWPATDRDLLRNLQRELVPNRTLKDYQ